MASSSWVLLHSFIYLYQNTSKLYTKSKCEVTPSPVFTFVKPSQNHDNLTLLLVLVSHACPIIGNHMIFWYLFINKSDIFFDKCLVCSLGLHDMLIQGCCALFCCGFCWCRLINVYQLPLALLSLMCGTEKKVAILIGSKFNRPYQIKNQRALLKDTKVQMVM